MENLTVTVPFHFEEHDYAATLDAAYIPYRPATKFEPAEGGFWNVEVENWDAVDATEAYDGASDSIIEPYISDVEAAIIEQHGSLESAVVEFKNKDMQPAAAASPATSGIQASIDFFISQVEDRIEGYEGHFVVQNGNTIAVWNKNGSISRDILAALPEGVYAHDPLLKRWGWQLSAEMHDGEAVAIAVYTAENTPS